MKLIHRLVIAVALLGSASVALAQDHDQHDRRNDHGHDRGHDDHHNDRGHDDRGRDNRGHDDHRGYDHGRPGYGYRPEPRYYGHPGPYRGHWVRGHRYYGPTYVIGDYGYYRLRPPPYGYHWVRGDDGFLLVAISTGIILDIVAH